MNKIKKKIESDISAKLDPNRRLEPPTNETQMKLSEFESTRFNLNSNSTGTPIYSTSYIKMNKIKLCD